MLPGARQAASKPATLMETARVAAWALALDTGVTGLGAMLAQHRAGALAMQAFAAEWGAGRLAVVWSDPDEPAPSTSIVLRRVRTGALLGLGAASLVVAFALVTRAATPSASHPSPAELLMGLVIAALIAMRDELLLRGLVLRTFRHALSPALSLVTCAAVGAAARLGEAHDQPLGASFTLSLVVAALTSVSFATLWLRERGAWTAFGAHTAWTLATTTCVDGGLLQLRWAGSSWGGGTEGLSGSLAVVAVLALVTTAATFAWYRTRNR